MKFIQITTKLMKEIPIWLKNRESRTGTRKSVQWKIRNVQWWNGFRREKQNTYYFFGLEEIR